MTFPLLSNCKIHKERTSINNLVIESIILLVLDPFVISSKLEVPLHFRQSYFWAILFSDHKPATDNQNNVTKPNAEKSFVQEGEYSILFSYFEAVTRWKRERSEVQVCRIIKVSLFFSSILFASQHTNPARDVEWWNPRQEVFVAINNNLLFHFRGHNNSLLVLKLYNLHDY